MVGSPDYFDPAISGAVNAVLAQRQPGSAIKPLTYAAALDPERRARRPGRRRWTAATIIADLRTAFPTAEGEPYVPNNYDRRYHGPVTVRTALANSYNIPAVRTLDAIGVDALIEQAARVGIPWELEARDWKLEAGSWKLETGSSESEGDPFLASGFQQSGSRFRQPASRFGLSLTLGGGEVRLLDLTAAYAAFANGGQRMAPYTITRVETLEGETVWDQGSGVRGQASGDRRQGSAGFQLRASSFQPRALDPRVAYLITDILSDERGAVPAFGQGNMLEIGRPAAAKTGTTTDWRDNWTLGYTPDLTVGVWVGNAGQHADEGCERHQRRRPIWRDFMISVLRDRPPLAFSQPDGLVHGGGVRGFGTSAAASRGEEEWEAEENVSSFPPHLFTSSPVPIPCPQRRYEWFIAGTEPDRGVDRSHVEVAGAMPAPVCRSTRRRHHNMSSRRRSGSFRRSTLRGRGRMKCRSWHKWRPRLETRGRGDAGSARICCSWRRWALSNERAGRRISLCSSAPLLFCPPAPPLLRSASRAQIPTGPTRSTLACRRARNRCR